EIVGQLLTRLDLQGIASYADVFYHMLSDQEKRQYTKKIKLRYNWIDIYSPFLVPLPVGHILPKK
ncbi:MAG: hypothetical protein AAGM46_28550, partial [Cyanobacteria bacterium J06582_2]